MRTAVVILNWNTRDFLKMFLPSLVAGMPEGAEVVVADNGSTDGSVELMVKEFPDVRLIRFDNNQGFTGGYNSAFEILRGSDAGKDLEYFTLINSDIEAPEGWLEPLVTWMDSHQFRVRRRRRRPARPVRLPFLPRKGSEKAGERRGAIRLPRQGVLGHRRMPDGQTGRL